MKWGGAYSWHGWDVKCKQKLVGMPEWKRVLERPGHRCEGNIKVDLRETGFEGVDLIQPAQERFVCVYL